MLHASQARAQMELFADRVVRDGYGEIVAEGNVEAQRGEEMLRTDHLRYDPLRKEVFATGHVRLRSPRADIAAQSARMHTVNDSGELQQAQVVLPDGKRIQARSLKRLDTMHMQGEDVRFSECPPDDAPWRLHASRLEIDQVDGIMHVRNARFEIGGIPVFYAPYWQYPLRRRSGLLMPQIGTSKRRGSEFALPLYLAPAINWDATLTPRWMTRRGWMNDLQLRHASSLGAEEWRIAWLHDKVTGTRRYHLTGHMQEQLPFGLLLQVEANQTSDYRYLSDYAVDGAQASARFIQSSARLGWNHSWGSLALLAQRQQDLTQASNAATLQWLPRLESHWNMPLSEHLRLHIEQQATHFSRPTLLSGWRSWLHPWLEIPFAPLGGALEFTLRSGVHQWNYWQLQNHPQRSARARAYASSLQAAVHLERISANGHWRHAVTPTLRYDHANAPTQTQMPNFDSGFAQLTMSNLLAGNRFTGLDRIERMRRISALIRNELQFKDERRKWTVMTWDIGMAWDVLRSSTDPAVNPTPTRSYANLLLDFGFSPNPDFQLAADGQYDPLQRYWAVAHASARLEHDDGHHLELSWQHTDARYASNATNLVGMNISARLYRRWQLGGNWQYDSALKLTQQATGSLTYQHPCWSLRIEGFHINRQGSSGSSDRGFRFQLAFKGLGGFGGS